MDFKKLVSYEYLFQINRVFLTRSDKLFFWIGAGFLGLGFAIKLVGAFSSKNPANAKLFKRLSYLFITIGAMEVAWFGARYENIIFFGTHFFALLILFSGLVWLGFILKYVLTAYGKEKQIWQKEQLRLKYLPK